MSTIFSRIIKGEIPSYKVAEDEQFFAFLDINPIAKGHALVVPKIEIDYIFDLEDKLLADMIVFAKKVAKAIESSVSCNRVGLMVVGLEVPHAHIHLIPINKESDMSLGKARIELSKEDFENITQTIRDNVKL